MANLNYAFWAIFILTAALSLWLAVAGFFVQGVIFALVVILIGLIKLEQDSELDEFAQNINDMSKRLHSISQNVEKGFNFSEVSKDKTEKRIQRLDAKRVESDKKMEKMFRDLVRKIIEIENTLNKMKREMGTK
ncbi:MAG: hypothetical protein GXO64_04770 [Candidatus Micrarchaeota archaeon]|nr:hypothetical protein [Candidatus Micrarchaeota archaeon]